MRCFHVTDGKERKEWLYLVLAVAVIVLSRVIGPVGGLSADAVAVVGVFLGSLLLWITVSIDWPSLITLLALGLIPSVGFLRRSAAPLGTAL